MTTTYAIPMSLCMRFSVCDYCNANDKHCIRGLGFLHGIKSCGEHYEVAVRDINAYFHKQNLVKIEAFLKRFPQLSELQSIRVPRSDGSITEGGTIVKSDFETYRFIRRASSGDWVINVSWIVPDDTMSKDIKVNELALSGIDVEPIIAALNDGFYKADYDAQMVAKAEGTLSLEHQAASVVAPLADRGLVYRTFVPGEGIKYVPVTAAPAPAPAPASTPSQHT